MVVYYIYRGTYYWYSHQAKCNESLVSKWAMLSAGYQANFDQYLIMFKGKMLQFVCLFHPLDMLYRWVGEIGRSDLKVVEICTFRPRTLEIIQCIQNIIYNITFQMQCKETMIWTQVLVRRKKSILRWVWQVFQITSSLSSLLLQDIQHSLIRSHNLCQKCTRLVFKLSTNNSQIPPSGHWHQLYLVIIRFVWENYALISKQCTIGIKGRHLSMILFIWSSCVHI